MNMLPVVVLWSLAVFLATVFAAVLSHITLKPRHSLKRTLYGWGSASVLGLGLCFISYLIRLQSDLVGILGMAVLQAFIVDRMYEGHRSAKLFVSLTTALLSNVCTFMLCGTTDSFLGTYLNLFANGPYNVLNVLLFIGIKLVVYPILYFLYRHFLRDLIRERIELAGGRMDSYLVSPMISVVGFYVVNMITNNNGIMPNHQMFFPLYSVLCVIFIFEYLQIFNSLKWAAEAMRNAQEKERIGAELNVATQIQADMLPSIFPAFPERKDFDIYATMDPAKEVGGDFYDFFLIDGDHLGMVMADVSGKGVPAALFMVIAKTLLKNSTMKGGQPADIVAEVNNQLCEGNEAQLFVTAWLAVLELSTGRGVAVNAGHEHPCLRRAEGSFELVKYRHSPALATMEGIPFRQHEFRLQPGDTLFVYTDGVCEATNADNELFGEERMVEALNRRAGRQLP